MGHLTRAAAILRKLRRLVSGDIAIITNSPFHYLLEIENLNTIYLKNLTEIDQHTGSLIRDIIDRINPELFIVDTYPEGIRKELLPLFADQHCKRALLRRHIEPQIISPAEMEALAKEYYDLVLNFESLPTLTHNGEIDCHPLLIRDADELLEPGVARGVLMAKNSEKVVLAVTTDQKGRSLEFLSMIEKAFSTIRHEEFVLRFASPHHFNEVRENWHTIRYFPLFELFRGVDLLVATTENTNVFYETCAAGLPSLFIQEQDGRPLWEPSELQNLSGPSLEEVERKLREAMDNVAKRPEEPLLFENRAQKAAAYLSHLLFATDAEKVREYRDRIEWFLM
jgi:hypothetical protein